jgi:hypothetical protein
MLGAVGTDTEMQRSLNAMLQNITTSSAIEGEQWNVGSVRSSLARWVAPGNCHDNAVAESFFQRLKRERIRRKIYSIGGSPNLRSFPSGKCFDA